MRSLVVSTLLLSTLACAAGCSDSHGREIETDGGQSLTDTPLIRDSPPIHSECPPGINPWNPMDPGSLCSPEGSTCSSGSGDQCGSFMSCTCTGGHWNCAVAEADPVCWCGRQPSPGDRCNTEGMSCGECCPTPGGTGWPAMQCVSGHWQPGACPDLVCPPIEVAACPASTASLPGTSCFAEGAQCGDPCCGDAVTCTGGSWQHGPDALCFACLEYPCGDGHCRADQTCVSQCGATDGVEYTCEERGSDCSDCGCITLRPGQRCEMVDGHPHVSETGLCG